MLLLVAAELYLAPQLGGQSPAEYVASRDPVSGAAYALSLMLFALMPVLVARNPNQTSWGSETPTVPRAAGLI